MAKYLLILNGSDVQNLDIHDVSSFFRFLLERIDWKRDLHFQTKTTIDTLDYSGEALNQGSKVVMAAVGKPIRSLSIELGNWNYPPGFSNPRIVAPGILTIESKAPINEFLRFYDRHHPINGFL